MPLMGITKNGFKCLDCEAEFKSDAEFYAHPCPGDGFKQMEEFESDGHELSWKCPGCGKDNKETDFWEVLPENNGYHGECSLYCSKCDREFDFKFEVEYSVEVIDGQFKEVVK